MKVFPGHDNIVRSAEVKTKFGVMKRPVTKLALLEECSPNWMGRTRGEDVTAAELYFLSVFNWI